MLEEQYRQAYDRWRRERSPGAASAVLDAVAPVLRSAVRTFAGEGGPVMESRARLLERYDPARAPLRSHLMSHLRGLQRYAAAQGRAVYIPERVALQSRAVRDAENELEDRLGRAPSTAELADHTGLSPARIARVRTASPGLVEGQTYGEDDEGAESQSMPAVRGGEGRGAWRDFVYQDLHPTDQVIMEHALGLHGRPATSKTLIAKKLGLSPGAVSQRAAKIQKKLDLGGGEGAFGG
jgi:hypothetical protein